LEGIEGLKEAIALKTAITEEVKPLYTNVVENIPAKEKVLMSCKLKIFGSDFGFEIATSHKAKGG
jgi:hypothetical protein